MNKITLLLGAVVLSAATVWAGHHGDREEAAAEWSLDPAHSVVGFTVRHLGLVNVRGHFNTYEGTIHYDGENIESLKIKAHIQAESIDTNVERRDDHLRSEDFFEVETYPTIRFHSTGVVAHGDGHGLTGHLTIKDVTKEVTLPLTVNGPAEDAWGNDRIGIELGGEIERHDYGVGFDGAPDRMIGSTVRFDIHLQAIAASDD